MENKTSKLYCEVFPSETIPPRVAKYTEYILSQKQPRCDSVAKKVMHLKLSYVKTSINGEFSLSQ